jgi:cysteine desulfurase
MKKIYLDYAATTPLDPAVFNEMSIYMIDLYGNPSSVHKDGIVVRKAIQQAKQIVAKSLNADANEVFFCSGGTEATNWAIKGYAKAHPNKKRIITTQIEHHATLHTCKTMEQLGYDVIYLPVDHQGFISKKDLDYAINDDTLMVSIIWGNNEIGTIQKIEEIIEVCQKHKVILHVDAVQIFGQMEIDLSKLNIDMLSLSAHKFYGPKGSGVLYLKEGTKIEPLIDGGSQQNNYRAGTENVYGIVGFAKACELVKKRLDTYPRHIDMLATALYSKLRIAIPNLRLNGADIGNNRLLGHLSLSFPNCNSHDLAFALDAKDLYVSTGSACTSTSITKSHVLEAIKLDNHYSTIRITFGIHNESKDIDDIADRIISSYQEVKN